MFSKFYQQYKYYIANRKQETELFWEQIFVTRNDFLLFFSDFVDYVIIKFSLFVGKHFGTCL